MIPGIVASAAAVSAGGGEEPENALTLNSDGTLTLDGEVLTLGG